MLRSLEERFAVRRRILLLAVSLSALFCLAANISSAQTPPHVPGELLVRFQQGTSPLGQASAHAGAQSTAVREFQIVEGLQLVRFPDWMTIEEAIARYLNHLDVLYAEPNYIIEALVTPNDPSFGDLWGLHNTGQSAGTVDADIDAPEAWDITTGSANVVVAVIDTGIDYNHEDLSANMFQNSDDCNSNGLDDDGNGFVDDCHGIDTFSDDSNPMDGGEHGTHVAGTIGAVGNNNLGVVGVNWNVRLMACRFLGPFGGSTSDAIDCLEYVKLMKDRGVNIVATNNSWGPETCGEDGFSQALYDAIEAHLQRGILFIAAAGNGGPNSIGDDNDILPCYPANYYLPNVISVAATTRTDGLASYSNFGRRTVHLGAPGGGTTVGSGVLSTVPGNNYEEKSGTSMATPHVVGVAALLKAQDSSRDWKAIKNLILAGGNNNSNLSNTVTQKRLNAHGAMTCSNSVVQSRLRPIANSISGTTGTPIDLAVLHINCAQPNGNVTVTVSPGSETITLLDDGLVPDQASGDGIYSGDWTPTSADTFTLAFPGGDNVTVTVSGSLPAAKINVTPDERNFGNVIVGETEDRTFTVKNVGSGMLSGSASTSGRFSIVSGGSYSLAGGDSQTVTVRFSPTSAVTSNGSVTFTGGVITSRTVTGTGVTANFILTVSKTGSGSGTVSATGISCGSDCKQAYSSGSSVTLTATAASGSVFSGWSGGGCSGTGTCTVTMSADTTVTATFTAFFTLTVSKGGTGSGTVTSSPSGVDCGSTCSKSFSSGTSVTLTATPGGGSVFAGWSGGGCSGTGTCTVTMNATTTVTATFNTSSQTFTLQTSLGGSASGTVTSSPTGINCGSDCSEVYAINTSVTLTASAGSGASFKEWGGACSGTSTTCTVTMSAAKSAKATFSKTYTDDPITSQSTPVKAVHITDLRQAINTLRSNNSLSAFTFTDLTLTAGTTQMKAVHITELRSALSGVYTAKGLTQPSYTDPTITAGQTTIKKAHVAEIRQAVKDAE